MTTNASTWCEVALKKLTGRQKFSIRIYVDMCVPNCRYVNMYVISTVLLNVYLLISFVHISQCLDWFLFYENQAQRDKSCR